MLLSTLIVFVLSIIGLFLLGFVNYYVPDEEDAIAMQFMRDKRNSGEENFDEECVIISDLRFGVLAYLLLSLVALAITLGVYFTCDYQSMQSSGYSLVIGTIVVILHIVIIFVVACLYTVMPFLGEYFQEWKTSMFYEDYFGVKVLDSEEEGEDSK